MKVLVTGGAGYIGSTLIPRLLRRGYGVTVLDTLTHGAEPILPLFRDRNFELIRGDVRDYDLVKKAVEGKDGVVHLAAVVGMPACKLNPRDAESTNVEGSRNVRQAVSGQRIVYASTVSAYGRVESTVCTEETPLHPLSLYGETKAEAEKILLTHPNTVALRFATAFGLSPRMRLDLMVNDFTYQAVRNRSLIVYQADYVRSAVHVEDIARAIDWALVLPVMAGKVYNVVGCSPTKKGICEVIKKETGAYIHFAEVGEDVDQRSAAVSSEKIYRDTGFVPKVTLEAGVHELARAFAVM